MNDTEINVAIAKACGWHVSYDPPHYQGLHPKIHQPDDDPAELPSYTTDLNAMHEAEKVLQGSSLLPKYGNNLQDVTRRFLVGYVEGDYQDDLAELALLSHATASQRAQAFLKTLNLWKD